MNFNLNKNLVFVKSTNLYIRVILNFDYIYHFFINYSVFIIYDKIQSFIYDIINLNYNVNNNRVILIIFNVLYVLDINVNLFSIKRFLNVNIEIIFL